MALTGKCSDKKIGNDASAIPADWDVIIVGAGPAGSSAAIMLAREGVRCLLLDRAIFPRMKVCGDGLAPQALYWLDKLGCVDEVLDNTRCCIRSIDLYINGGHVYTAGIPETESYPGFFTLLRRERLDHIMAKHAVRSGARFIDGCAVRHIECSDEGVTVETVSGAGQRRFTGKLLLGADGAGSLVARHLGCATSKATRAVSLRGYFKGVTTDRSSSKIYFNEQFFPGYGWLFVDDDGVANVGVGALCDGAGSRDLDLRNQFTAFIKGDLGPFLANAEQVGRVSGGWAAFSRMPTISGDRVMLLGDAANRVDPLNGGGIHGAMESSSLAVPVALKALESGDCSRTMLGEYDRRWKNISEFDWQSAELLLSFAKNRSLRELYLLFMERATSLLRHDPSFGEFCTGIFTGTRSRGSLFSPTQLFSALPLEPGALLKAVAGDISSVRSLSSSTARTALAVVQSARNMIARPSDNIAWGIEMFGKMSDLGIQALQRTGEGSLFAVLQHEED